MTSYAVRNNTCTSAYNSRGRRSMAELERCWWQLIKQSLNGKQGFNLKCTPSLFSVWHHTIKFPVLLTAQITLSGFETSRIEYARNGLFNELAYSSSICLYTFETRRLTDSYWPRTVVDTNIARLNSLKKIPLFRRWNVSPFSRVCIFEMSNYAFCT